MKCVCIELAAASCQLYFISLLILWIVGNKESGKYKTGDIIEKCHSGLPPEFNTVGKQGDRNNWEGCNGVFMFAGLQWKWHKQTPGASQKISMRFLRCLEDKVSQLQELCWMCGEASEDIYIFTQHLVYGQGRDIIWTGQSKYTWAIIWKSGKWGKLKFCDFSFNMCQNLKFKKSYIVKSNSGLILSS